MSDEHTHDHGHGHGHTHDHGGGAAGHTHGHTDGSAETSAAGAGGGAPLDRDRLLVLVRNWVDHNEGHKRSYLEWRDRLAGEGLPVTTAAMERLAALTDEATLALNNAIDELGGR